MKVIDGGLCPPKPPDYSAKFGALEKRIDIIFDRIKQHLGGGAQSGDPEFYPEDVYKKIFPCHIVAVMTVEYYLDKLIISHNAGKRVKEDQIKNIEHKLWFIESAVGLGEKPELAEGMTNQLSINIFSDGWGVFAPRHMAYEEEA